MARSGQFNRGKWSCLMEGEWLCYRGGQFNGGRMVMLGGQFNGGRMVMLRRFRGGQFNGGRMVMLQK